MLDAFETECIARADAIRRAQVRLGHRRAVISAASLSSACVWVGVGVWGSESAGDGLQNQFRPIVSCLPFEIVRI